MRLPRTIGFLAALAAAAASLAAGTGGKSGEAAALGAELAVERRLLASDLDSLGRVSSQLARLADRVDRLSGEMRDALRSDDSDGSSLDARESALRDAEHERDAQQEAFRRLRTRIIERRARLAALGEEIRTRRDSDRKSGDLLSGTWDVVSYPGPQKGTFELSLEGAFLAGQYQFEGNWRGSLRGNVAGDRVRLERWDSEQGFSAIFYGRLSVAEKTIKGTWESTDLSGGKPSAGTWVARRRDEPGE